MNNLLKSLNSKHQVKVAGAGNKFVYLLDQNADCYINLVPGFKYWDLCASEALILSRMGIVTDAYNRPIIYDDESDNYTIRDGIIAATNKTVYDVIHQRVE